MCGFGIHIEERPHRFDKLRQRNPKEWDYWMNTVGWGKVLDYIGVGWRDIPVQSEQLDMFSILSDLQADDQYDEDTLIDICEV